MFVGSGRRGGLRWIACALWLASACSDGASSPGSLAALGIDDGASKGETRSALIKASKEASIELKTGARVTIPEGAIDDELEIVLKRPPDREALPLIKTLGSEYKVVSAPYVITPHGTTFNKDIEISLPVGTGKQDRLEVAYLKDENDRDWEVQGKASVSEGTAKVAVDHLSVYVLIERLDAQEADAGEEQQPDAGGAVDAQPQAPDAGIDAARPAVDAASDAASMTDAAPAQGSFAARLATRLHECNLVAQEGALKSDFHVFNRSEQCAATCLFDAACVDLAAQICIDTPTGTDAYQTCLLRCFSFSIVECLTTAGVNAIVPSCDGQAECMDGSDEANCPSDAFVNCVAESGGRVPVSQRCDGYPDCTDGSDEQGCPAGTHFVCANGELVSNAAQCDGASDCADGSDEARCAMFTCRDGAQQVPQAIVCDFTRDCSDGSDEDANCLRLTCDPRGDERIQP